MRAPRQLVPLLSLIALLSVSCKSSHVAPPPGPAMLPTTVPLVGFMPLPGDAPAPGSADFDALFANDAPWSEAMGRISFFGFFGNWVNITELVTDARLESEVAFLNAHSLPIGNEMAMIEDPIACAAGVEGVVPTKGFASGEAQRIHDAGGAVRIMRADDPWSSQLLSGNPCNWTAADVATRLAATAAMVRAVEPDVLIEDTDTLSQNITSQQLLDFVDAFAVAAGRKLDGFVLDIDYNRIGWGPEAVALEAAIKSRGIRFGVIYHGDPTDPDDAAWFSTAESRYFDYELLYGGKPDEVLLESWMHLPSHVLPETQASTFTNFVDRYFRPRPTLTAAVSGSTLSGTLTAADGTPMAGAAIDTIATLTSGSGAPAHYSVSGTIPAGTTQAVMGVRENEECGGCDGNADLDIYDATFTVGGSATNLVPDSDFSSGPWYSQGSGSATVVASDNGPGQMFHVVATPAQMELAQSVMPVTAGQTYSADFFARIPPATVGSGHFAVIFTNVPAQVAQETLLFAAATSTASGVTDANGAFAIDLGAPPTNAHVDVWYRGDDSHFAAHAGL